VIIIKLFLGFFTILLILVLPLLIIGLAFSMKYNTPYANYPYQILFLLGALGILFVEIAPFIVSPSFKIGPFIVFGSVVICSIVLYSAISPDKIKEMLVNSIVPLILGVLTYIFMYRVTPFEKRPPLKENINGVIACVILLVLNTCTEAIFLTNTTENSIRFVIRLIGISYDVIGVLLAFKYFTVVKAKLNPKI